jgi:tRNA G26 N,N-dimethylase Trm1
MSQKIDIELIPTKQIAESEEIKEAIKAILKDFDKVMPVYSRKQLAKHLGLCEKTIDNLNSETLKELGWKKVYANSKPLFKMIAEIDFSRETFRRVKRESR